MLPFAGAPPHAIPNLDHALRAALGCIDAAENAHQRLANCESYQQYTATSSAPLQAAFPLIPHTGALLGTPGRKWQGVVGGNYHLIAYEFASKALLLVQGLWAILAEAEHQPWTLWRLAAFAAACKPFNDLAAMPWDELRKEVQAEHGAAKAALYGDSITVSEAAALIDADNWVISQAVTKGQIKNNGKTGRDRRIDTVDFVRWALTRKAQPAPDESDEVVERKLAAAAAQKRGG